MNQHEETFVDTLKRMDEEITTLNLNDCEGWNLLVSELTSLIDASPEMNLAGRSLAALISKGLQAVADKKVPNLLSLTEVLSGALHALIDQSRKTPDADEGVSQAEKALRAELFPLGDDTGSMERESNGGFGDASNSGNCEEHSSVTLDDIAAFLLQLEPEDEAAVTRLRVMIERLVADGECSPSVRTSLEESIALFDTDSAGQVPAEVFDQIGKHIEAAMAHYEKEKDMGGSYPSGSEEVVSSEEDENTEPSDYMPKDADPDILKEFITESMDLIAHAEEALLTLENDPDDLESVGTVFRAFHTIKGTSAFLEVIIVSNLAHHAESLLSRVRDGEIRYGGSYAELSLYSIDMLKELVKGVELALDGKPLQKPEGYDDLILLLKNPPQTIDEEDPDDLTVAAPRVGDILVAQSSVSRQQVEAIAEKQSGRPIGEELLKENAVTVKDVARALRTQKRMLSSTKVVESSVRVQTDRLDRLIDMVGEMVIAHSMIAQDSGLICNKSQDLQKKIGHASKIVRELQDLSMSMRMVPLKPTFQKMARVVRDLSSKSGKKVQFITQGEDTEIDRNMVDLISDPLLHMVRNAVDHGIDDPADREKRGKPREGTVLLSAYHSAGNVVVEVRDDGRGLDRDAIVTKARMRGILSEESNLSEREILNLIFEPGFSTAKTITDVSGRGVGLDVVKRNIEMLRGKIEVQSEPGKGSTFKIRAPLTLAIIDGMVILAGTERYIIPTISIVRSLRPKKEELSTIFSRGEMLSVEGRLIPLFRLSSIFHVE
ncbi:MAG TPA: chemotaxis protein CheA, partial [Thermodesulfobacteriota bacterium]|nr:chemotaxis protein CheA [Thermodesulfobacteriota bacterium]